MITCTHESVAHRSHGRYWLADHHCVKTLQYENTNANLSNLVPMIQRRWMELLSVLSTGALPIVCTQAFVSHQPASLTSALFSIPSSTRRDVGYRERTKQRPFS